MKTTAQRAAHRAAARRRRVETALPGLPRLSVAFDVARAQLADLPEDTRAAAADRLARTIVDTAATLTRSADLAAADFTRAGAA